MTQPTAYLILDTTDDTYAADGGEELLTEGFEDLHLAEDVERGLRASGHGSLRRIGVTVHDRIVTLSGRVPSYYLKQIAQAAAQAAPGPHEIHNCLEVVKTRN